jgi:hypothetical protein
VIVPGRPPHPLAQYYIELHHPIVTIHARPAQFSQNCRNISYVDTKVLRKAGALIFDGSYATQRTPKSGVSEKKNPDPWTTTTSKSRKLVRNGSARAYLQFHDGVVTETIIYTGRRHLVIRGVTKTSVHADPHKGYETIPFTLTPFFDILTYPSIHRGGQSQSRHTTMFIKGSIL